MTSPVRVEEHADRVIAVLDRPDRRNAIDLEMVDALHDLCAAVERRPRPLLLTGAGQAFAAGADIAQLRDRGRDEALRGINRQIFDRIASLPLPTVAAINGVALGGGAELAYACDVRVAATTARFANPEPGLGILAAAGAAYRLPALIGTSAAKAVLLAGASLDADDALRLGLVVDVVEPDELLACANAIVDRIVVQDPLALRLTKLAVAAPAAHPLVDDLTQAVLFESDEKHRRMTAFLERK